MYFKLSCRNSYAMPYFEAGLTRKDIHKSKLDPLLPGLAGGAKIGSILTDGTQHRIVFMINAIMIISCVDTFLSVVAPPTVDPSQFACSATKWADHFAALVGFNLIQQTGAGVLKFCAKYFAVPKTEDLSRAIFNGLELSRRCTLPFKVNLPDLSIVLQQIAEMCAPQAGESPRRVYLVTGDIRHWFHQIPVPQEIGVFFGLHLGTLYYLYRVLPMGWSWSPHIAQCIAMGLVLVALSRCGVDITAYANLTTPPPFVVVRDKKGRLEGIVCVWYDNIALFTTNENLSKAFFRRHVAVMHSHHVIMKHWRLHTWQDLQCSNLDRAELNLAVNLPPDSTESPQDPDALPIYLGMMFGMDGHTLQWKHHPVKVHKWKSLITTLGQGWCSARDIAAVVGVAVWNNHISLKRLLEIVDIIDLLKTAAHRVKEVGWDTKEIWPLYMVEPAIHLLTRIVANPWMSYTPRIPEGIIYVCADSSTPRFCYLAWSSGRQLIDSLYSAGPWWSPILTAHIFAKELCVATMAIEAICERFRNTRIILGEDNTAVVHVLTKCYSTTDVGLDYVRRVVVALDSSNNDLVVIPVPSESNPADPPTRLRPLCPRRTAEWWLLVERHPDLHLDAHPLRRMRTSTGGLRHGDDDDADQYGDGEYGSDEDDTPEEDEWCDVCETLQEE